MTNDVFVVALNSVVAKLAKSNGPIAPGSYSVDETVTIRLAGTVEKLEDEVYTPTVDIPLKRAMALLLARMGVQREAGKAALVAAMSEALTTSKGSDEAIDEYIADVDSAMNHVQSVTAALPPKVRTGKTKVDATIVVAPVTVTVP
jgi:hypothetical protein